MIDPGELAAIRWAAEGGIARAVDTLKLLAELDLLKQQINDSMGR